MRAYSELKRSVPALAGVGLCAVLPTGITNPLVPTMTNVPVPLGSMEILALAVAASVQIVGALLVMTLLVTPAAAALRLTSSPLLVPILSMVFAVVAVVGGILLALGGGLPISPYVTSLSFAIYLVARVIEKVRGRQVKS
jgi:zinc/manganese transport system permease protein